MEVIVDILFWLHLTGLVMGGAVAFGMPVVGSKMPSATTETRPVLFSIAHGLSKMGRAAIALLIITGPLLIWLKFGGMAGFSWWFTLKMVLVVVLIIGIVFPVSC